MSDNIIQLNQELIYNELKDLVRNSVEETLNALLIMKQMNSLIPINMSVPVNVKVSLKCISQVFLFAVLRILPRHYGEPKFHLEQ